MPALACRASQRLPASQHTVAGSTAQHSTPLNHITPHSTALTPHQQQVPPDSGSAGGYADGKHPAPQL